MNPTNYIDAISLQVNSKELPIIASNYQIYTNIYQQCDVVRYLVEERKSLVNANGWDVKCKMFSSEVRNRNYAWRIYQILSQLDLNKMANQFVKTTSIYGQSFARYQNGKFLIEAPESYKVWYDQFNQEYLKFEVKNYNAYQAVELEDVYIFQDSETDKPFCVSPIDSCYLWILLYLHAVEINNNLVSGGGVGSIVAIFEKEMESVLAQSAGDENDPKLTKGKQLLDRFKVMLSKGLATLTKGQRTEASSHNIAFLAGLKELKELGQSNQDLSLEMLLNYAEKAINRGFGVVQTSEKATYSNAKTFNYIKWDLIGKSREEQFARYINEFVLPKLGIETNENLYFEFNKPNDPDEVSKNEFAIKSLETQIKVSTNTEYKAQLINEYRDSIGLEPIDVSLFENQAISILETPPTKKEGFFLSKLEEFKQEPTPVEKALKSKAYSRTERDNKGKVVKKGLLINFHNGIKKQLEAVLEQIQEAKTLDEANNSLVISFPKLETFYSMNTLKKDLYQFLDPVVEELKSIKETFAVEDIPEYLIEYIDSIAGQILKGTENIKSVDTETQKQIFNIINDNYTQGKDFIAQLIVEKIPEFSLIRATNIATTTVNQAVEGSRELMYKDEGFKYKKWLTVRDSKVRDDHIQNQADGWIPIDDEFSSGDQSPGSAFRCRCTVVYSQEKQDQS
jgi:hypothetical protein